MKCWLRMNKIYFETLGVSIPVIAALVVSSLALQMSCEALQVSRDARDTSIRQVETSQQLNRPLISAVLKPRFDGDFRLVGSHHEILNHGNVIRDLVLAGCGRIGSDGAIG